MKTFQSPGKDEIKEAPLAANVPAAGNPIVPFDEEVIKSLILPIHFLVLIFFNSVSYTVLTKGCILKMRAGNPDYTQHTVNGVH